MTRQPRHVTFNVLRGLGIDEAVIGDLEETSRTRLSTYWFWRQVVSVVNKSIVGELRVHALSVIASLAAGWFVVWEVAPAIVRVTIVAVVRSYDRAYFQNGGLPPLHSGDFIWILNFSILFFTNMVGGFAAVRLYNGQRRLLAIMFALMVVCQRLLFFVWHSRAYDPSTAPLYFVFRPSGQTVITLIALESMAALAGGLAATQRRQPFGQ
jgi:hypothetical protein